VIGAPKLLSIEHPHGIASRLDPQVSRTFVSLGVFALCAFALAFAGEEAQAQELPQAQHTETGEQVDGKPFQTPVEATPTEETSLRETRPARTSPVEPASQTSLVRPESANEEPSPAASRPALGVPIEDTPPAPESVSESVPQSDPVSGSTLVLAEQGALETPVDPALAFPDPKSTASEPETGSVSVAPVDRETAPAPVNSDLSPLDLEPEPVAMEESHPLSSLTGEAIAAEPAVLYAEEEEDSYFPYTLETSMVNPSELVEGPLRNAAADALGIPVDETLSWPTAVEGEGSIDATLSGLFYRQEAGHSPASESNGETKSSPAGTVPEWPLQDSGPQPVSPFTPPAGSSFSLSGGQVGAGIVALLLCVLASGLILPRREFKLSWAFCELPKPSSVLLLPPERPG
jgi:hypothetical protein